MDILIGVVDVGTATAPGLLGPIAVAISSTIAALLGLITTQGGAETANDALLSGYTERAILAEASLQALLSLPKSPERDEILAKMEKIWSVHGPAVHKLSKFVIPYVEKCALQIALMQLSKHQSVEENIQLSRSQSREERDVDSVSTPIDPALDRASAAANADQNQVLNAFTRGLLAGEEGAGSWLGKFASTIVHHAKPLVSKVAWDTLTKIISKLTSKYGETYHSPTSDHDLPTDPEEQNVTILLHRAMMADLALQTIMTLSEETLNRRLIGTDALGSTQEGLLEYIKRSLNTTGDSIQDMVQKAVEKFWPIINNAVKDLLDIERKSSQQTLRDELLSKKNSSNTKKVNNQPSTSSTSLQRRLSLDSNDDYPVVMTEPPPEY